MARARYQDEQGNIIEPEDQGGLGGGAESFPTEETPTEAEGYIPEPEEGGLGELPPDFLPGDLGGSGSTAGGIGGDHDPDPMAVGAPDVYTPYTSVNPLDPSANFSRKLPRMGGVQDATSMYSEAPGGSAQTGALLEEILRMFSDGTA
jgi:hypothetical protein